MNDNVKPADEAANGAAGMVERTCSREKRRAVVSYGLSPDDFLENDDAERVETRKKGCMKTLYGPVTGFYREGA